MLYVITDITDNSVILGPVEWNSQLFSSIISKQLELEIPIFDFYKRDLPRTIVNMEIRACKVSEEQYDPLTQILKGPVWSIDKKTGIKKCEYKAIEKPLHVMKSTVKQTVAEERWKRENSDIEIDLNGASVIVSADRDLRKSLFQKSLIADETSFAWKFKNCTLSINKQDIEFIIKKIDEHVQNQFDWEVSIMNQVRASESVSEIAQIVKSNIQPNNVNKRSS